MKSSSLEKYQKIEDKIIKGVRNLFRLKKEIGYTTTKDVRNLFRLEKKMDDTTAKDVRIVFRLRKENKSVKDRIIKGY